MRGGPLVTLLGCLCWVSLAEGSTWLQQGRQYEYRYTSTTFLSKLRAQLSYNAEVRTGWEAGFLSNGPTDTPRTPSTLVLADPPRRDQYHLDGCDRYCGEDYKCSIG